MLLAAALPQPPPPPHGKAIAASYPVLVEDINDDDENPDKWLNTGATDSLFMPNMEEPYRVREECSHQNMPASGLPWCPRGDASG
jgi:hypothetical protein